MSWSVADPICRAEVAARGLTHTERLAVAWRLVEGVDDPEDFRQLDMFLGLLSAHCDEVRLSAALEAAQEQFSTRDFACGGIVPAGPNPPLVGEGCDPFILPPSASGMARHGNSPAAVAAHAPLRVRGGGGASLQATTTHEQNTPVPGPGPRRLRAALARAGDALSRSDDTWAGSIVGALCFAAAAAIGIISAGVLS